MASASAMEPQVTEAPLRRRWLRRTAPGPQPATASAEQHTETAEAPVEGRLRRLLRWVPRLFVAGTLAGSAAVVKIAPLAGVAPSFLAEDVARSYKAFAELPPLRDALAVAGFGTRELMIGLAAAHILASLLMLVPYKSWPAKVAGLWAMAAMVGAEYCTRTAGVLPPATPAGWEREAAIFGSALHAAVFLAGAACCFNRSCPPTTPTASTAAPTGGAVRASWPRLLGRNRSEAADATTGAAAVGASGGEPAAKAADSKAPQPDFDSADSDVPPASPASLASPAAPAAPAVAPSSRRRDSTPPPSKASIYGQRLGAPEALRQL